MCSHFGARVRRRHMMRETPRARRRKSLNVLTAREPMGLSSRRQLILLSSHHMALSRELMNPSQIAREIEIFSYFCLVGPHVGPEVLSLPLQNLMIMMINLHL